MTSWFARWLVGLSVLAVVSVPAACSDDACDDAKCAAGNRCIAFGGETKCRKTCTSNTDPLSSCPFGYTCTSVPSSSASPFCAKDDAVNADGSPLVEKPTGQWGKPCRANLGVDNPECDRDQGFFCYGALPSDANAYCTRYDCTKDSECGPGFGCVDVNQTPNLNTGKRLTFGTVQKICVRRTYCSACTSDLDCLAIGGKEQRCIPDASGALFCATSCASSSNCQKDAVCVDAGVGVNVCYPRATVCVGDGNLCSPCRSDADCGEDGICFKGEHTEERACAKKAKSGCSSCPKSPRAGVSVVCAPTDTASLPKEICFGAYPFGGDVDLGCWTPASN